MLLLDIFSKQNSVKTECYIYMLESEDGSLGAKLIRRDLVDDLLTKYKWSGRFVNQYPIFVV